MKYPFLSFHQYGSKSSKDELILFAAKAKDLYRWAGIPRKGWHIRMLFQRPISPVREAELKSFWARSSNPGEGEEFILGPTSIIVALQNPAVLENGTLDLGYKNPVDMLGNNAQTTASLAKILLPKIMARLTPDQNQILNDRGANPYKDFPSIDNDYVFEFALQLQQMSSDADRFFDQNQVDEDSQNQIIQSMDAVLRPAIVVDGQHRLYGAANVQHDIWLPVVAIPDCDWTEQIYQFVVINEKAQKVEPSMLTDIFGSSLTSKEQGEIRNKLLRSNVDIESRISAVVASRTAGNPFENMIVFKMDGPRPANIKPFLSERTIRVLIDGSQQKYSWGWRTNEDFYKYFVSPTFHNSDDWDSWASGAWERYWYAFWEAVRDFYNEKAAQEGRKSLWIQTEQTNLTKAVALRQVQTLFMMNCVEEMKKIDDSRSVLIGVLNDYELVDQKLREQKQAKALPESIEGFKAYVRSNFLENGIPAKVFASKWKASLDDPQGQVDLWETLETAFKKSRAGERFHIRGRIFEATDE